jgi:hypothetical protein
VIWTNNYFTQAKLNVRRQRILSCPGPPDE